MPLIGTTMGLIGDSPVVAAPESLPEARFIAAFSDVLDVNGELLVTVAEGGLSDPNVIASVEYFGATIPVQSGIAIEITSDTTAVVRAVVGDSAAGAAVRGKFELAPSLV